MDGLIVHETPEQNFPTMIVAFAGWPDAAEAATRALVDAIDRTLATNARMAKITQELSANGKVPMSLSAPDLVSRLSGRIAALMATIKGHRARLGALEWRGGSLYPPGRCWRDDEAAHMAAHLLEPLLNKGYTS